MGAKAIKTVCTSTYEIGMFQLDNGYYVISSEVLGVKTDSAEIKDFGAASFVFTARLFELEGH